MPHILFICPSFLCDWALQYVFYQIDEWVSQTEKTLQELYSGTLDLGANQALPWYQK